MREVKPVTRLDCAPFIIGIHYAKRWPSISYAFGLFRDGEIEGICTFGTPSSAPLRSGVCGKRFSSHVIELNRLCLKRNIKNDASYLVSRAIKMLPKNKIIVSFADISHGHNGAVYRACNFLYCGLSAKRTDWKVRGMEHLHGQTIADEFRGVKNRAAAMRDKYGDDFYLSDRPRKHRYIMISGSRKFRMDALRALRYRPVEFNASQVD